MVDLPKIVAAASTAPVLPAKYDLLDWQQRREAREQYEVLQGGKCYYCDHSLRSEPAPSVAAKSIDWRRFPPRFLRYPVHLHHDHNSGLTIGAVHAYCNAVLWQYHGK